ncbi:transporter [Galactobacter valiniphilus]|uniref:transporter n=1 Tax=Galactobacter valiniphilus TaxID=2676122 RepID=UPI0037355D08
MVAQLISLRWALFANGLKRNVWQLVGVIVGALYVVGLLVLAGVGLAALGTHDLELASIVAVLACALMTLGWLVIPVFFTGMDGSMDPQRFALFPIKPGTLAAGLLLAGFIGVPGVATLLFFWLTSLAYLHEPLALALSLVCALGSALVAQLLARTGTAIATTFAARRGVREVASILLFLPIFFLGPAIASLAENAEAVGRALPGVAGWIRFTPFGAFAGVPASVAQHDVAGALGCLAVGLVTLVVLWWVYSRMLKRAIVTPPRVKAAAGIKGLGWFSRFPATPWGAVAARSLTYWIKDPRYAASLAIVPMLVILYAFIIPNITSEIPQFALILGPLVGMLLGFSISADISYDSTAFALHVLTGVRGVADRLGRVVALLCIGLPLTLIASVVPPIASGSWALLPASLGAGLGTLFVSGGLASVASARWTYAVPLPGESPFKTPQGAGARMALTQSALMVAVAVVAAPAIGLFIATLITGSALLGWLTLVVGLLWGAGVLVLGVRIGGRWMEAREPELMQAVMLNR